MCLIYDIATQLFLLNTAQCSVPLGFWLGGYTGKCRVDDIQAWGLIPALAIIIFIYFSNVHIQILSF